MGAKVGIRPQARLDIVELATYVGRDNVTAANRFLDMSEETIGFLAQSPQAGAVHTPKVKRLPGLRVFPVKSFSNHLVFYLVRSESIEIVRVLHGARNLAIELRKS